MAEQITQKITLEHVFRDYAKFGNTNNDGNTITLTNSDKWMKEAGIIDGKKINTTDTAICFHKFKSKTLGFKEYMEFVELLAKENKLDPNQVKAKMAKCATPSTAGATKSDKSKVVQRMTDTSKYTGAHKQRFDDKGKGKGIEGREDKAENSGYVQGYKHKDTYDKKK